LYVVALGLEERGKGVAHRSSLTLNPVIVSAAGLSTTSDRELTVRPPFLACEGVVTVAVEGSIDSHVAGHVAIRAVARGWLETRSRLKDGLLDISVAAGDGNLE